MNRFTHATVLMAISVVLAASGCQSMRNFTVFNTAQEQEFGKQITQEVETQNKLITDPAVAGYVSMVGEKVAAKAERQDVDYTFKVIDSPQEVNAFAVPGGAVYVYSGLLTRMKSESELAAVLAHEVAHIDKRHSMAALTRQSGFELLTSVVFGEQTPAWQSAAAGLVGNVTFLKFSREDEKQADAVGLNFMTNAGYDPQGMVNLLTMFTTLEATEPSAIQSFLSSHPAPKERIAIVKNLIQTENLQGGTVNASQYQAAVKSIRK